MYMKIAALLTKEQKQQLNKIASPKRKRKKKSSTNPKTKKKVNLSFKDYESLMGKNMRTLHRKRGGAWG